MHSSIESLYKNIFNKYNRGYVTYGERADFLYLRYSKAFSQFNRIRDMNAQISGGPAFGVSSVMSEYEQSHMKKSWVAAEQYVEYVILKYPLHYMHEHKKDMHHTITITDFSCVFLPRIHVNLDRFIYVERRNSHRSDMYFNIKLNNSLFCYSPGRRKRVINRMRDIIFAFHPRFALRPCSFKRSYLPVYNSLHFSTVEGEIVYSRETYLDRLESVLEKYDLRQEMSILVIQYLFGTRLGFVRTK